MLICWIKDVAVTMGLVPENEYTLGYEAAGVVIRVGSKSKKFEIGDRVCFLNNGSYANRLQIPADRAHVIPSSMSFEVGYRGQNSSCSSTLTGNRMPQQSLLCT